MQLLVSLLSAIAIPKLTTLDRCLTEKDTFKPGKVRIIGLSRDTVEKQKLFAEKEKLTVSRLRPVQLSYGCERRTSTVSST
jgi:peroxiredoxin